ncbi:hypothetical protein, partial [Rhodospirillum rubrum]|uniref:hypothetical protein n=2 Tax=Rhodospirillum rubrum TaxID=1085 RepID=UPI0019074678
IALACALAVVLPTASQAAPSPAADAPVMIPQPIHVSVNAMQLAPFDPATALSVRIMDDSPANLRLLDWVRRSLIARGYHIGGDDAPLILDIDTVASNAPARPNADRSVLGLRGQAGTGQDEDSVDVTVRLFSNRQGSVIGGDVDAPRASLGQPDLRVDAGLTERASGRRVWQGWASVTAPNLGLEDQGLVLADPLIAEFGKATRAKTLTLPAGTLNRP